jgi:PKD repeat protein
VRGITAAYNLPTVAASAAATSVDSNLAPVSRRVSLAATIAWLAVSLVVVPNPSHAATNDISVAIDWTPASPIPGEVVTFTATASPPDGVDVKNYAWDLSGDGKTDKHGVTATWSYPAPGPVDVSLRVKGSGKHRGETVRTLSVQAAPSGTPLPPVASFTVAPPVPFANQPVLFTSTSGDPDGTLREQVWDLNGDGNYDNGGGGTALRTFSYAGEYVVGLRVTDDAGLVSFASQTVTVLSPPGTPGTLALVTQRSGARLLSPFPVVRIAGRITRRGTRVRLLRVSAPVGARVSVRCTGRSCPFKKQVRTISTSAKTPAAVSFRVRRLERLLVPGVRVRVYVTKRGVFGKYTRFRFRAGKAPARTDSCLSPGSLVPTECPAS